jgi:hypothetical protein
MKRIITLFFALAIGFGSSAQIYLDEDFSTFVNPVLPPLASGWKNVDSIPNRASDSIWRFDNPGLRTPALPISAPFASADGDWHGTPWADDTYLSSTNFDASGATVVLLEFDHYFRSIGTDGGEVQIFDGSNWITDTIFTNTTLNSAHEVIDISQYVAGISNAQIRFRYTDPGYGWYWIIDNVTVFQPLPDDAAVVAIDSLPISACNLDTNETISARIVNFGSTVIRNIPIRYTINGGPIVPETILDSINPGDTLQYSFATKANLSAGGSYDIVVYTGIRGDANQVNDSAFFTTTLTPAITNYPYSEGFENGSGAWTPGGINGTWAVGIPSGTIINSAANGLNAYVTNPAGFYQNNDGSFVISPCFDFSSLNAPQFKMNIWYDSESSWDGAVLQMTIDDGITWTQVGAFGNPNNWYNDNTINGLQAAGFTGEGWTIAGGQGSGGWLLAEHDLPSAANEPSVRFRIFHGSDGSVTREGFAFDDILILDAPSVDVGVASFESPVTSCGLGAADSVCVRIANFGSTAINNIPVAYEFNGQQFIDTVFFTINPGDTSLFCFNSTINVSASGTYNIRTYTMAANDGNAFNDTISNVFDNIPVVSGFPYLEGFENGNGGWVSGGSNSTWAIGTPAGSVINSAANGFNAYATNLTGQYNNNEESWVQGPCFDFSTLNQPQIKMNVWWNSEFSWDGAVLQSSIDGGATWQKVGAFGDPNNWYTDNSINGLQNNLEPSGEGWSGRAGSGSAGWLLAEHDLSGLANQAAVILRVAFGSDGSVQDEGFAFDDILILDAPAADAGTVALVAPNSGCGLGTADSVRVSIANFGSAAISNFAVSFEFNSSLFVDTVRTTINPGDTTIFTFTQATVDVSLPGAYSFLVYTDAPGDGNLTNDTLNTVVENTLKTAPFSENFDAFNLGTGLINGWTSTTTTNGGFGQYLWQVNSGQTGSANTGPSGDNTTGFANYMYTEASNGVLGDVTTLTSPCIDASTLSGAFLGFYYHMLGTEINTLYIEVGNNNGFTIVDSIVGAQQTAVADPFLQRTINISSYLGAGNLSVRFSSVSLGCCGGDISIDDFRVYEPSSTDAAVLAITEPLSGCGLGNDTVKVLVQNVGLGALNSIPLSYSVNNGAAVMDTSFVTLNPGDSSIFAFAVPANLSTTGTYRIQVYSDVASDGNRTNDTAVTSITNVPVITVPYTESFETSNGGWTTYGTNFSWTWGTPSGSVINTAGSGSQAWVTNLTGVYSNNENSYLESPCMDFSGLTADPNLTYLQTYNTEACCDEGWVELSIDGGNTWTKLIDNGGAINWYNNTINQYWNGTNLGGLGVWDTVSNVLSGTAGQPSVKIRIAFSSDGSVTEEGFGIDSISIDIPTSIVTVGKEQFDFSIYPNPTQGEFTLLAPTTQESINMEVLDSKGQLVYSEILPAASARNHKINIGGIAKGIYFVKMNSGEFSKIEKLIIH